MQVLILKTFRLYNVFSCSSSHGIYAIFIAQTTKANEEGHGPTQGCRDQVWDLVLCNASRTMFGKSSPCYFPWSTLCQAGHRQDKQSRHACGAGRQVEIILACSLHPVAMCLSCPQISPLLGLKHSWDGQTVILVSSIHCSSWDVQGRLEW